MNIKLEINVRNVHFFLGKKMTKFLPVIYFWNNLILHTKSYSIFPDKLQIVSGWTNACEQRHYLSILLRYSLYIWFSDIKLHVKQCLENTLFINARKTKTPQLIRMLVPYKWPET